MANIERSKNKLIRTDEKMELIYEKYQNDFFKKNGIWLCNQEITKKIAEKIEAKGGIIV